ncbi:MAG: hypothetical protein IJZ53_12400 [Tyzzerella sp.]|nr:hypothetical protein [Tyzzerella sp.]
MKRRYALDSSAAIYLASMNKKHTNVYRFSVMLKEKVNPEKLQEALDNVTPRFPVIVAGIKRGMFDYYVDPVEKAPRIQKDEERMAVMSKERVETCAMRVLYREKQISVEIFHSITDGGGAMVFLGSLLAEYLRLCYSIQIPYSDRILNPKEAVKESEVKDDYITYAGGKGIPAKRHKAYQLPNEKSGNDKNEALTRVYKAGDILKVSREYGVSMTVFLAAVMAQSLIEIKRKYPSSRNIIQVMLPINLRSKFKSDSLQNFSLYAFMKLLPDSQDMSLEEMIRVFAGQMEKQSSAKHLQGMMTTNVKNQNWWFFKILPLPLKKLLVEVVHYIFGESNSCITMTNMGRTVFPEECKPYVEDVECIISPRRLTGYNCSIISYEENVRITLSRYGKGCGLEDVFYEKLESLME